MKIALVDSADPDLHTKAEVFNPREWPEMAETIEAMFELMVEHDGMGLAAPQVGISKRLFIMLDGSKRYVCINPTIKKAKAETKVDKEGCLSFPGETALVERSIEIKVSYQDGTGKRVEKKLRGLMARCFLHELDHLNGIVMHDVKVM